MMSSGVPDFQSDFEPIAPIQFKPYVEIVEQPAEKSHRFRYLSEGKSAGSIRGVKYTQLYKSYPTIRVVGYHGKASVVVSCVLEEPDMAGKYKQHPHKLVGKEGCENGVCRLTIPEATMSITFSYLGIHRVTKKEIEDSLNLRKKMGIDPFNGGFSHGSQIQPKHLKTVRLCFQVYLEGNGNIIPLDPIVSNPIVNNKSQGQLMIVKLSHCVSPASGSQHDIMMFCEKIDIDDIQIRFYENKKNSLVWEDFALFKKEDVHKEVGISFRAPSYKDTDITESVTVFIQLVRPSDGVTSEGLPFEYSSVSTNSVPRRIGNKRARSNELLEELKRYNEKANLPSTLNDNSFNPRFSQNVPLLTQMHRSSLEATPRLLPSFESLNSTSQVQLIQNISLLDQLSCLQNNDLETTPKPLGEWRAIDRSNRFLITKNLDTSSNSSNIELDQLNLMDLDMRKESQLLNAGVLAPNTYSEIKVNNHWNLLDSEVGEDSNILNQNVLVPIDFAQTSFNNFSITNNEIPSGRELPRDGSLTWLEDETFDTTLLRKMDSIIPLDHEYTEF